MALFRGFWTVPKGNIKIHHWGIHRDMFLFLGGAKYLPNRSYGTVWCQLSWFITSITMVYCMVDISILMVYKPANITGTPPCMVGTCIKSVKMASETRGHSYGPLPVIST